MSRFLLVVLMLAATAGAVVAYGDPKQIARASDTVSELLRKRAASPGRAVQIARGQAGEFALHAKINGVNVLRDAIALVEDRVPASIAA